MRFFQLLSQLGLAALVGLGAGPVLAQPRSEDATAWPTRDIKIVVSTAPGQASDVLARLLAQHLQKALGKPVIVDNRPGGGGSIAYSAVAKALPDGYTLVIASSGPLTVSPAVFSKMAFDPVRDFDPIANIALTPQAIAVNAAGPYRTLQDLVAAARTGDLAFAIPPLGSTSHLAYAVFAKAAQVNFNLVPFKGNVESTTQVINGDVAAMYDTVPGVLSMVRSGRLRVVAVAAPQRSPFLPDVPTLAEQGIKGADAVGWIGLAAPARTPAVILDKLSEQVRTFLAAPATQATMKQLAFVPVDDTSRQSFQTTIRSELDRWSKTAKDLNIRIE